MKSGSARTGLETQAWHLQIRIKLPFTPCSHSLRIFCMITKSHPKVDSVHVPLKVSSASIFKDTKPVSPLMCSLELKTWASVKSGLLCH